MIIGVKRTERQEKRTFGEMFVDGIYLCDTIEDTDRGLVNAMTAEEVLEIKIKGETAIPMGAYRVKFTHSPKYGREMLQVLDVPGYSGIRIHSGNTEKDTEGCIILGKRKGDVIAGGTSRPAVQKLEEMVKATSEPVWIVIC